MILDIRLILESIISKGTERVFEKELENNLSFQVLIPEPSVENPSWYEFENKKAVSNWILSQSKEDQALLLSFWKSRDVFVRF